MSVVAYGIVFAWEIRILKHPVWFSLVALRGMNVSVPIATFGGEKLDWLNSMVSGKTLSVESVAQGSIDERFGT